MSLMFRINSTWHQSWKFIQINCQTTGTVDVLDSHFPVGGFGVDTLRPTIG